MDERTYRPGDDMHTAAERDEEAIALKFLAGLQIMAGDRYDRPAFTLEQNGVGFAPLGNIMAICAEMKNGKTWLMLQLAVALLRGSFGELSGTCEKPRILWFDTEQDKYDTMCVLRRVHQMCAWDYAVDHPEFSIYNLRDVPADKRREAIRDAVRFLEPQVVFIDGVRDLVQSVNEEQECYSLINDFMSLTARHHCSIWCVLHVNPNSDKMRGHLGTELGNKTTDVFSVKKTRDKASDRVTFSVEHVAARHRDVDGWTFEIQDFPGSRLYSVPAMLTRRQHEELAQDQWQKLHDIFARYMPNELRAYSKTSLKNNISSGESIGGSRTWEMISKAIEIGVIEQVVGGKYRLRKQPPGNDMPPEQLEAPF